jgi:hypothetical protein
VLGVEVLHQEPQSLATVEAFPEEVHLAVTSPVAFHPEGLPVASVVAEALASSDGIELYAK